jgi:bacterioferritin-associated ferredoxin
VYVCGCRAVTDRQVRAAVKAGASTVTEVAEHCGAAGRCGSCADLVHAIIEATRQISERRVHLPRLAPAT